MEIRFWGTRGSLPASINADNIRKKIKAALEVAVDKGLGNGDNIESFIDKDLPFRIKGTYGTNTPCIEIRDGDDFILCDAGSGLRDFGNHILRKYGSDAPKDFHIFISHLHCDHIQGLSFFIPALIAGNRITIYGCHENIREGFSTHNSSPFFPIDFKDFRAKINFVLLKPGKTYDIQGFKVEAKEQNHPGISYGYRFERIGKIVVYSTDSEHKSENDDDSAPFVNFFRNADLLIFDAQYTFAEACTVKEDWGHSNNVIGVELAQKAGVRYLCLFHQDPNSTDEKLDKLLEDTERLSALLEEETPLRVSIAWDGMIIRV